MPLHLSWGWENNNWIRSRPLLDEGRGRPKRKRIKPVEVLEEEKGERTKKSEDYGEKKRKMDNIDEEERKNNNRDERGKKDIEQEKKQLEENTEKEEEKEEEKEDVSNENDEEKKRVEKKEVPKEDIDSSQSDQGSEIDRVNFKYENPTTSKEDWGEEKEKKKGDTKKEEEKEDVSNENEKEKKGVKKIEDEEDIEEGDIEEEEDEYWEAEDLEEKEVKKEGLHGSDQDGENFKYQQNPATPKEGCSEEDEEEKKTHSDQDSESNLEDDHNEDDMVNFNYTKGDNGEYQENPATPTSPSDDGSIYREHIEVLKFQGQKYLIIEGQLHKYQLRNCNQKTVIPKDYTFWKVILMKDGQEHSRTWYAVRTNKKSNADTRNMLRVICDHPKKTGVFRKATSAKDKVIRKEINRLIDEAEEEILAEEI